MRDLPWSPPSEMPRILLVLLLVGLVPAIALLACGTIIHGTSQEIGIASQPTGANVRIDNMEHGTTPLVADLKRKKEHLIQIEMEGYQPYEMHVTNSVSGWVWGNIVFGGLIGLAVDAISGGLYKLEPEQVQAELARTGAEASLESGKDHAYIRVTLEPDPSWERIGTLDPVASP